MLLLLQPQPTLHQCDPVFHVLFFARISSSGVCGRCDRFILSKCDLVYVISLLDVRVVIIIYSN
jgi:hypothetical protein